MALQQGHSNSFAGAVSAARTTYSSEEAGHQLVMLVIDVACAVKALNQDNRAVFCMLLQLTYVS